jgi:hypothetical protein
MERGGATISETGEVDGLALRVQERGTETRVACLGAHASSALEACIFKFEVMLGYDTAHVGIPEGAVCNQSRSARQENFALADLCKLAYRRHAKRESISKDPGISSRRRQPIHLQSRRKRSRSCLRSTVK